MKLFKKILCTFLIVVLCLTSAPLDGFVGIEWPKLPEINSRDFKLPKLNISSWFSNYAAAINLSGQCGDNVYWNYNNETCELFISGTGAMYNYSGYDNPWSEHRTDIKKIIISEGVTNIGKRAFYRCYYATQIYIPSTIISIDEESFVDCSFKQVYITDINSWCNINFALDSYFYDACPMAGGADLYLNNQLLTNLVIPDDVVQINGYAFAGCSSIKSVTIGKNIKYIGFCAFSGCSNLKSVYISDIKAWCEIYFNNSSSNPLSKGVDLYLNNKLVRDLVIPDGVTKINERSFEGCGSLKSVLISDSVESIGNYAFSDCINLTSISTGDGIINISDSVFYDCENLERVAIGSNVNNIGKSAFQNCDNIKSVYITDMNSWLNINFNDYRSNPLASGAELYLNNHLLTELTIPNGFTKIKYKAFEGCSSLKSVIIPDGVTTISNSAFSGCANLVSVSLGKDVTYIGTAFAACENLKSITIPDSVTSITSYAFNDCSGLQNVTIGKGVTYIGSGAFYFCNSLTNIIIPNSVNSIDEYAFGYCSSLENVIIENGVEGIGRNAFLYCSNLTNITLPTSITRIGYSTFDGCNKLSDVYYKGTEVQWNEIDIGSWNDNLINATIHYDYKDNTSNIIDKSLTSEKIGVNGNEILITPRTGNIEDWLIGAFEFIGVKLKMGAIEKISTSDEDYFTISPDDQIADIVLSKEGYRDYILPEDVIASWKAADIENVKDKSTPAYKHTAFMGKDLKDGKPYISTVFARESHSTYQDITDTTLNINSEKTYDVIISAGNLEGKDCTYYIEQDAEHKISNNTGVFNEVDLFNKLEYSVPCYVYVVRSDGTYSDFVKVKFDRDATSFGEEAEKFLKGSSLKLLGNNFLSFKIPENVPLVGDAEISLEAFKLPAGVEIDGNSVKISIGANIFKAKQDLKENSYSKYKQWSKSCFSDWKDIVDGTTVGEAFDKTVKNHTDAADKYIKARDQFLKKIYDKEPPSMKSKSKNFNLSTLGYIDASIVNGQLVVNEALISVEGSFTFKYSQQGAIWVIPAYVYAEIGASLGGSALGSRTVPDNEIPFQWDFSIKFSPNLKVGAGAGVKDFASLGIWAKAETPVVFNFSKNHLKWDLTGSIGIEAQFIILKGTKEVFSGSMNLVDKYWGTTSKMKRMFTSFADDMATTQNATVSVADRDYLEDTTGWLGEVTPFNLRQLAEDGLTLTPLQGSVYDQASPRVVSFGDKMLMTWVEDDASRDTYNRMRLMYSIYNGSTWSEPVAVYDDGHNDNAPVITTDGEDVYFAWQKIDETITETNCNIETLTENCEIFTAKYDSSLNRIVDVKQATDNDCYDYAHNVSLVGDEIVYYWATCNDNQMNISSDNDIYRLSVDGTAEKVASDINYILSIDAAEVDGKESVSYSMDADGDTTTANDITVYTLESGSVTAFDKGDNDVAYPVAFYGELDGEETLFVSDMTDIYYMQNGELKNVLDEYTAIGGNINYLNKNGTPYLLWTQNEAVGNAVYSSAYESGEWTTPVKVSNTETQLSSVDVEIYNNEFMGVCTSTDLEYNEDEESYELGQVNLCSFKIAEVQDISVDDIYIDENNIVIGEETKLDVYVTNYGTTNIKNIKFNIVDELGFESTVEKEVNLLSGEGKFVELTYIAPENYGKTTLSVTAVCDEIVDSNSDNDTAVVVIGIPDIVLTESELIELDGSYILNAMVTNESDVSVSDVVINTKFNDSEDVVDTITIDTIEARETHLIEYVLTEDDLVFDEETNVAKVYFSVDTENKYITANKICFIIEKSETADEDSICKHAMLEYIDVLKPTCTESGYTEAKRCIECGKVIEAATEIDALGHNLSNWYTVTPAKCKVDGKKKRGCSDCDYFETDTIPALEHSYESVVTPATCTSNGYTTFTCSLCGNGYTSDVTEKLAHSMSSWYVFAPAKCTTVGSEKRNCTTCETYSETQEIPASGHKFDGSKCSTCGYDKADSCSCKCHNTGLIARLIWKITLFFNKILRRNKECACGVYHY